MRRLTLGVLLWLLTSLSAFAGVTCSVPYNLQNGTTADATQVMANYNALVTCFTNSAAAGANNDITSLSGLTTPIGPSVGGSTQFIGGTSTGTANAQVVATTAPTGFSLTPGYTVIFEAGTTNTGATQLNVNSRGLTNVYKMTAAGPAALTGGEIVSGQLIIAYYDGTQFEIQPFPLAGWGILSGAGGLQISTTNPPLGADDCSNLSITASVGSSILTLTFNGNNGSTPSATNPILCAFRDATIANGDPVWVSYAPSTPTALSITTNAAGATLGSASTVPFRFWIVMFNSAGTLVPGLINCSTPTQIYPLVESNVATSVPISAAATSAGVFYTPNGTTVTAGAFRIVGYLEYGAGLTTAGTYASVPTKVQLFGPGIKKPGDVVQVAVATNATASTTTSSTFVALTGQNVSITPTSTVNGILVSATGTLTITTTQSVSLRISQGTVANTGLFGSQSNINSGTGGELNYTTAESGISFPATTSSVTYAIQGLTSTGTLTYSNAGTFISATEIMG
jgi:hypothetical protein